MRNRRAGSSRNKLYLKKFSKNHPFVPGKTNTIGHNYIETFDLRGVEMRKQARRVSIGDSIVCPRCEVGEISEEARDGDVVRCRFCGRSTRWELFDYLRKLVAMPSAPGLHPCECGHPEMRLLPDGVYWCPSCGSEVLPVRDNVTFPRAGKRNRAYWDGWIDGRFRESGSMAQNSRIARWENPQERLDYYRGHREGHAARAQGESFPAAFS